MVLRDCARLSLPTRSRAWPTSADNYPGASLNAELFGESILARNRLMHELHTAGACIEHCNGLLLMRSEVVAAHEAAATNPEVLRH